MEKLTTKQLTKVVNAQHGQLQSLMGLINAYIDFKGDREQFGALLKEKYGKPAETPKND